MLELTHDDIAALKNLAEEIRASRPNVGAAKAYPTDEAAKDVGASEVTGGAPLGQIVVYRARTRGYRLPAIVTANVETIDRRGVIRGDVADITTEDAVHLNVQSCGAQLAYQEFDVPFSAEAVPGTWGWC